MVRALGGDNCLHGQLCAIMACLATFAVFFFLRVSDVVVWPYWVVFCPLMPMFLLCCCPLTRCVPNRQSKMVPKSTARFLRRDRLRWEICVSVWVCFLVSELLCCFALYFVALFAEARTMLNNMCGRYQYWCFSWCCGSNWMATVSEKRLNHRSGSFV